MCKIERKEIKKQDAWNRKNYGKRLAKIYKKLSKIKRKFVRMYLNGERTLDSLTKEYEEYSHKCWQKW